MAFVPGLHPARPAKIPWQVAASTVVKRPAAGKSNKRRQAIGDGTGQDGTAAADPLVCKESSGDDMGGGNSIETWAARFSVAAAGLVHLGVVRPSKRSRREGAGVQVMFRGGGAGMLV
jgi:hypothetical protein